MGIALHVRDSAAYLSSRIGFKTLWMSFNESVLWPLRAIP
jgi:hypothetical protein